MAAVSRQGFKAPKQEKMYFQFVMRAVELLQAEILLRRLGTTEEFDQEGWERKILKIYKALTMMETHKTEAPFFSRTFQELVGHLMEKRRLEESDPMMKSNTKSDFSRFSMFEQMPNFDSIWHNPLSNSNNYAQRDDLFLSAGTTSHAKINS